jgi:hypothetical protein
MATSQIFLLKIDEICLALDSFRKGLAKENLSPTTKDGKLYSQALHTLSANPHAEPLELLDRAEFKPFLLMNGFIFFSSLKPEFRGQILEVLSASLKEFSNYYSFKEGFTALAPDRYEERRWMAFLLAYLPAAGMDLLGVMITLKGDCFFEETKLALREILEGDEHTLSRSPLFPEAERTLLQKILESNSPESWSQLSFYLVKTYALPQLNIKPLLRS